MKLTHLALCNFAQHRNLEVAFSPGLVGITGPNGTGKSNLLHACFAALTNDFSRLAGGKSQAPCQQRREGEPSWLRLTAEHHGTEFEVQRTLLPSVKHKLRLGGREFTKDEEIRRELEEVLGVSRGVLEEHIFVPQGELFSFLEAQPAARARSLAKLCGTDFAEVLWELLGRQMDVDRVLTSGPCWDVDALQVQYGQRERELQQAQQDLQSIEEDLLPEGEIQGLDRLLQDYHKQQEAARNFQALEQRMGELSKELDQVYFELPAAMQQAESLAASLEALRLRARRGEEQARQHQIWRQAQDRQYQASQRVEQYSAPPVWPIRPTDFLPSARLAADLRLVDLETQQMQDRLRQFDETQRVACPVCGTPVEHLQAQLQEWRQQLPRLRAQGKQLADRHERIHCYEQKLSAAQQQDVSRQARLAAAQEELLECARRQFPEPSTTEMVASQELSLAETTARAAEQCRRDLQFREQRLLASLQTLQEQQSHLLAILSGNLVSEAQSESASQELLEHRRQEIVAAAARESVRFLSGETARLRTQLQEAGQQHLRQGRATKWLHRLEALRDAFHRDRLPSVVHRAALARTQQGINDCLSCFENPFWVEAADNLDFTAIFANGTRWPAAGLSGGQKMMLAFAFRMTLNKLFAGPIGMLALDEPTAGLDRDHLDQLTEALGRLKVLARSEGYQILLVTHEESVAAVCDQVVSLSLSG